MTRPAARKKAVFWGVAVAIGVVAALYFFQSSTLAPNQTDEGMLLQYIEEMAHGELPFYDFVDAYGLLNWVGPVTFFEAFGHRVWGVRMWMIVLKLATLAGAVLVVRGIIRRGETDGDETATSRRAVFYASCAGLWTAILLGAQWQSLQTAYAFIGVMPFVLFTWYFVLCAPLKNPRANVWVAAVLTTVAIWTKLNTGLFLFAGGLFAYFFWIPVEWGVQRSWSARLREQLPTARQAGAFAYALLFLLFLRKHNNVWFFLYLVVPLGISVFWAWRHTVKPEAQPERHLDPFLAYLALTGGLSLAIWFGYYGKHCLEYARELSGILSLIRYTAPFPSLGSEGVYIGLNENFWLQMPWLLTALFGTWIFLQERGGKEPLTAAWPMHRARLSALFLFVTLHAFVMYARSDETHVFQALVLVIPVLFVVMADVDRMATAATGRTRLPLRIVLGVIAGLYASSLFVTPTAEAFQLGRGDWKNPKCEYLRYRRLDSPYVREFTESLADRYWDVADDSTAAYVKSITEPGEEMLLLTANRLVYFNSDTRPMGGRYHFFFYLASVGLLDRKGFDKLVPKSVIDDIIARPPRVIVGAYGWVPLAVMFPELKWLRDSRYERTRTYKHIYVHELRIDGQPVPHPNR